jgi:hypothetical protein
MKEFDKASMPDSMFTVWNGRQIRNAFQTAIALAEYDLDDKIKAENVPEEKVASSKRWRTAALKRKHFKKVSKAMQDFDRYVRVVHKGAADAEIAEQEELRADAWDPKTDTNRRAPRLAVKSVPGKKIASAESTPSRNLVKASPARDPSTGPGQSSSSEDDDDDSDSDS